MTNVETTVNPTPVVEAPAVVGYFTDGDTTVTAKPLTDEEFEALLAQQDFVQEDPADGVVLN